MIRKFSPVFISCLFALGGCQVVELPTKLKNEVNSEHVTQLKRVTDGNQTPNVFAFNSIYVPPLDEKERRLPDWYFAANDLSLTETTISKVSNYFKQQHGFSVEYRIGALPDKPVLGRLKADTVGELIELISASTGYQFDVVDNSLVWRKYTEEVFPVRALPGVYDYSIGKRLANQNQQNNTGVGGQNNFAQAGAVSNNGDEYSNISGQTNAIDEYLRGIEAVLGCKDLVDDEATNTAAIATVDENGNAVVIDAPFDDVMPSRCVDGADVRAFNSDNSIYVRALPSQMDSVRAFVKSKNDRSMRSIRVDITLLTVTSNDSSALDLSLDVQDILDNFDTTLTTISNSAQSIVGGLTQPGSLTLNHESGTQAVIQALSERGDILQKTVISGIAINNRIGNFTNVDKVSFISDRRLQTTSNVGATTGIEQQVAESGVLLYMFPNIGEDNALVHISTSLSDLVTITKKGEIGNEVESPQISDRVFNTALVLEPNRPVLAGGSTVREIQAVTANSGISGYSRSGQDRNTEILMIVEATFL